MIMTLYYVARHSDYQNTILYVAGPFGSYHQACDAKDNSTFSSEYLRIFEQTIEVNE